jgi:hypothetical protein
MRLPLHIAAPFAAAKTVAALSMLPQHIAYLSLPQISSIAIGAKSTLDLMYNSAIALLAGTGGFDVGLPTQAPCPQLALMLWFDVCLACLLPLYCLAVMEMNSRQLDSRRSSRLEPAAAVQHAPGTGPLQLLCTNAATAAEGLASGSSSSSGAALAPEATAARTRTAATAPADHAPVMQLQEQQVPFLGPLKGSIRCFVCHASALFLTSCLLWAVVDVGVAAFVPQCGKPSAAL